MGHVVKSALVVAKDEAGRDVYLYRGDVVPSSIPAAEIKRLAADDFIGTEGGRTRAKTADADDSTAKSKD